MCYRRNGHNEIDEPMFTQPLMYNRIRKLKPCIDLYSEKLVTEGVVTKEEAKVGAEGNMMALLAKEVLLLYLLKVLFYLELQEKGQESLVAFIG